MIALLRAFALPIPRGAGYAVMMGSPSAFDVALCLLARSSLAGILLFVAPPIGELPPLWQVGLAFLAWLAWCYWRGLFGQYRLSVAVLESIPSLWLSLKWTNLLVVASALASA